MGEWVGILARENSGENRVSRKLVQNHHELEVYQVSFEAAMKVFEVSARFPREERYSLTDQIRRSSRSVCANLAEAWRKRIYKAAFISKISDSTAEAAETQTWIEFAVRCSYLDAEIGKELHQTYDRILGMLVNMSRNAGDWTIERRE